MPEDHHDHRLPDSPFRLWAFGDAHVGTDKRYGRRSLAEAITHSEAGGSEGGPPFEWDIAIDVGDMSGAHHHLPDDAEGSELRRQFASLRRHRREAIYSVCGNHDRSGLHEPEAWWWQKWVDPLGQHTEFSGVDANARPYPVEGAWDHYSFRVGNLLFLMLSDRNEPTQTVGRGPLGGNPGGVVSGEAFRWWKHMVLSNPDSIIIVVHHYVLKDTTVASGEWEGVRKGPDGQLLEHYHRARSNSEPHTRRPICIGWTANQTPGRSKTSSPNIPAGFTCGSPGTPTPTPTTAMAAKPISNNAGAHGFSTSHH